MRDRTSAAKTDAFRALTKGLDDAYAMLRERPSDHDAALAKARATIATFFKGEEASAFQLYAGEGVWMLHAGSIWLARDDKKLLTELAQLPPGARAKLSPSASP